MSLENSSVNGGWKRYPKYKDSGVEWLGNIPDEWEIKKIKFLTHRSKEINGPKPFGKMLAVSGYHGIIPKQYEYEEQMRTDEDLTQYRIVHPGQLVVNTMWLNYAGVGISDFQGHVSPTYDVFGVRNDIEKKYLHHILRSSNYVSGYCSKLYGIRPNSLQVGTYDWDSLPVLFPQIKEQTAIAHFLDHKTNQIDSLILKRKQQIGYLWEKQAAIIGNAVMRGLNPSIPMKESGVEWLGMVPNHWEVCQLNYHYDIQLGKMLDTNRITGDNLAPYLRNVDVQWGKINISNLPEMDFNPKDRSFFRLNMGDLLVCEGGEVGRTAIWKEEIEECYYQKALHRLRPKRKSEDIRFFYYQMVAAAHIGAFNANADVNTIGHLTAIKLKKHIFVFPPKKEQAQIADFLDKQTQIIQAIISKTEDSLTRLSEYRSALISAAVTGKIDVRKEVKA